jgi:hypothetical protein
MPVFEELARDLAVCIRIEKILESNSDAKAAAMNFINGYTPSYHFCVNARHLDDMFPLICFLTIFFFLVVKLCMEPEIQFIHRYLSMPMLHMYSLCQWLLGLIFLQWFYSLSFTY